MDRSSCWLIHGTEGVTIGHGQKNDSEHDLTEVNEQPDPDAALDPKERAPKEPAPKKRPLIY
ncbi:MAG: hypothetical protein O3C68_07090, partial [Proteobacteria bacterium]|nr:hypothetical protein [Pseudomonadota bacterium]